MTGKGQCCRNCCHLHVGNVIWCQAREEAVGRAVAESPNRCHSFAYTPVDAFGGSRSREDGMGKKHKKKQCDGQMSLF